jgi:hypothetical protein
VPIAELRSWIEEDWLGLWELADIGGLGKGVSLDDVTNFVIDTVEPGLRAGVLRLGRVYGSPTGAFEAIDLSLRDQLDLIRDGVRLDKPDLEIDLWFDALPIDEEPTSRPGLP